MKFETKKVQQDENRVDDENTMYDEKEFGTPKQDEEDVMDVHGDGKIDILQAALYNAGTELMNELKAKHALKETDEVYKNSMMNLSELRHFYYNVGFAGEQSSGKSTVINSIIKYPLMSTCNLTTTCVSIRLVYGKKVCFTVFDDDTGERVLEVDCEKVSHDQSEKLKEYACAVLSLSAIENVQYFTDKNVLNEKGLTVADLTHFDEKDPKHIAVFFFILLTVYIGQNSEGKTEDERRVDRKRTEVLNLFGFPKDTVNYSVQVQWDNELLKSGMIITDLPGLGAYAGDKKVGKQTIKGHERITTEAIQASDAMVFLVDDSVKDVGTAALKKMLSSAKLKDISNKGERIIPVLNKADRLNGQVQVETSVNKFLSVLSSANIEKKLEEIRRYSAIFGEYDYKDISFENTLYYIQHFERKYEEIKEDEEGESEEFIREKTINKMKKYLCKKYNNSGIEELTEFFRTTYIQNGKYHHTDAAFLAIRGVLSSVITPLRTMVGAYEVTGGIADNAIKQLPPVMTAAAAEPIEAAVKEANDYEFSSCAESLLDAVPGIYVKAFRNALSEYKNNILNTLEEFDLFMYSARIDVVGSRNYDTYQKLKREIGYLPVDVAEVNKKYGELLKEVSSDIKKFYNMALNMMEKLKDEFPKKLHTSLQPFVEQCVDDAAILKPLYVLENSVAEYVQAQIGMARESMISKLDTIDEAGDIIANEIIEFNYRTVNKYTESITRDVHNAVHGGAIFSSRDYLKIKENDGLEVLVRGLALSADDEEGLETDIRNIGKINISSKLASWQSAARKDLQTKLSTIDKEIKKLIKDTVNHLQKAADDNGQAYEMMKQLLHEVEAEACRFMDKVQDSFDQAQAESKNTLLNRYVGNILADIISVDDITADGIDAE